MVRAVLVAVVCMLLVSAGIACAQDGRALFAAGERAFAAGDYREALRQFTAAREAGSTGPSSYYNIGVCRYLLREYEAAEATFAKLAAEFPAMRDLAEYNRGLALRAAGDLADARVAFGRARASADDKIVALANAQLTELNARTVATGSRWGGYLSGGFGYDDNVALVDELVLPSGQSSSSPFADLVGVLSKRFGSRGLRLDASGYLVQYTETDEFDQSAVRLALGSERRLGTWTLAAGPTLGRSTLDGDGLEELLGVDLRLRRSFASDVAFDARVVYDDIDAGDARYAYLAGSRRQLRLAVLHTGSGRTRAGYDLERNDRADPGVSASRQRWSVSYLRPLSGAWTTTVGFAHRKSRYSDATVPREERLLEVSFGARRELSAGWTLSADYRWSDNDSTVDVFSYDGQRVAVSMSRSWQQD
jgi:tetratricopeptide (TPR) repeat protein